MCEPTPSDLSLHIGFKVADMDHSVIGRYREDCRVIKPCFGVHYTSGLAAVAFWKRYGNAASGVEQDERFWRGMEEEFKNLDAQARKERVFDA